MGIAQIPVTSRRVWGRAKLGDYIQYVKPQKAFHTDTCDQRAC